MEDSTDSKCNNVDGLSLCFQNLQVCSTPGTVENSQKSGNEKSLPSSSDSYLTQPQILEPEFLPFYPQSFNGGTY
jgi:hypothetical protein